MILKAIIIAIGYAFAIFVGSPIIEAVCRKFKLVALEAEGIKGAGNILDILNGSLS